jgi:RNA polymerase sigma factor (sigma-70 family)
MNPDDTAITIPANDQEFEVIIQSRMYHADLLRACRACGSLKNMAAKLRIGDSTLGNWIRLKEAPSLQTRCADGRIRTNFKLAKKWPHIVKVLFEMTGKTTEQLFPDFIHLPGFMDAPKIALRCQVIKKNDALAIAKQASQKQIELLQDKPTAEPQVVSEDVKERIRAALATLTTRQRQVLTLRFGLDGSLPQTLAETAKALGVTRERIRQIEVNAMNKLGRGHRRNFLKPAAENLLMLNPCPLCNTLVAHFSFCSWCGRPMCGDCLTTHIRPCYISRRNATITP